MLNRLRDDVEQLASHGTRKIGTHGHLHARQFLGSRMKQLGLKPYSGASYELPYTVDGSAYTNLAGVWRGGQPDLEPILLVSHYDTCGDQPGADDNAAAIAIWLDVISNIKSLTPFQRDIILLIPDAEEPPHFLTQHMGSTNFYNQQLNHRIHCGLVLDLVGHDVPIPGMKEMVFIIGAESHPNWEEIIMNTTLPHGLTNFATLNRYIGDLSDHHILRENSESYLFLTCGRWEHYHSKTDRPEHLNYDKMERLSEYLGSILRNIDATPLSRCRQEHDPLQLELTLIKRALGDYLMDHGIRMENRDDVQKFVMDMVKGFDL